MRIFITLVNQTALQAIPLYILDSDIIVPKSYVRMRRGRQNRAKTVVILMHTMHVITEKFDGLNTDADTRTIQYDGQNDRCRRPDHTI